jgi:cobalt/nickel transport system permease protein
MTVALVSQPSIDSPLCRLDPRWKLAAIAWAIGITAMLQTLPGVALAAAGVLSLLCLARLPARWLLPRLGMAAIALLAFAIWLPFSISQGSPPARLGPLSVSPRGITVALTVFLKGLAIVSLVLTLIGAAPLERTLKAARSLRVPSVVVQLLLLAHRYLAVLVGELMRLRLALRVRGYRNRANWHSYRTVGHVAGTLLVRGSERAQRVGQAMRCRGFDGQFRTLDEFRTRVVDVAFLVVIVSIACTVWAWDHYLRA